MPRKKPYSGKQKKQQLQEKRNRKDQPDHQQKDGKFSKSKQPKDGDGKVYNKGEHNPSRYKLNFLRETAEEIAERKKQAQQVPIEFVPEIELEISTEDVYSPDFVLEMPKRPKWNYSMSKQQLEQQESRYFTDYLDKIHDEYEDKNLSYFEHNLETWRQAWRVLERSDVIVMVTDVRHPIHHFSPALYNHVTNDLKKPLILVLNKIDLVPASVVAAWNEYFQNLYPKLRIVWFTSFPRDVRKIDFGTKLKRRPQRKRIYHTHMGPRELLAFCKEIVGDEVDLSSWKEKINRDISKLFNQSPDDYEVDEDDQEVQDGDDEHDDDVDDMSHMEALSRFHNGILTVGFLGHPNVGKSSLMNGLIGKKVVSTSVTPGHTKYYQTYFLTKTVRLCDSPGLVFPSLIDKQMQILSGIYPIAQVQEPYTSVGYLAARVPIVEILKLVETMNEHNKLPEKWTAWSVCEAWAVKKGYYTAKAARPDVYRAANSILRMTVDGRLCLYMRPPGYAANRDEWEKHELTHKLLQLRVLSDPTNQSDMLSSDESSSQESDDENDADNLDISLSNPFDQLEIS